MRLARTSSLTALVTATLLVASPASAQRTTVTDPAGDASGAGLDIVHATVRNRDRAAVARIEFVEAVRGDLIVGVRPRHSPGVRLVSEYRPKGTTRSYVLRHGLARQRADGRIACRGYRVVWHADREVTALRLPSRCLDGGDYGAVVFSVLTERGGGDTDYAPETTEGELSVTGWVPRG